MGTTKQDIKIALLHCCQPSYVDYNNANNFAIVRFSSHETASDFIADHSQDPFLLKDVKMKIEALTAEEEHAYFKHVKCKRDRFAQQKLDSKKKMDQEKPTVEVKKKRTINQKDVKKRSAVVSSLK